MAADLTVRLLEHCARTLTDFDIASLIAHLYNGKYRYVGGETWERWNDHSREWIADPQGVGFMKEASHRLYSLALERALFWQEIANAESEAADNEGNNVSADDEAEYVNMRAERLLKFSVHVQKPPVMRGLVDETRAFLDFPGPV